MTKLGLLKSGKLINRWTIERGNPLSPPGQGHTSSNQVPLMRRPSTFFRKKKKKLMTERGQPVVCLQRGAMPQQFTVGDDEAELKLSLGSRSFLDRVNDQVRIRQKRSSMNVTENDEKHSVIWGMFMSVTLESALFMGKNYSDNQHSIKKTKDLTKKQMFDISAKLAEQDERYEDYSWKYLSLIGDEQVISLQRTKVYVCSDSVLCLGKIHENLQSNTAWEDRLAWFKSSPEYRDLDRIDCEPMEFEWNIPQNSIRCSLVKKSKVYC